MPFERDDLAALIPGVNALLAMRINEATEEVIRMAVSEFENKLRHSIATSALEVARFYELSKQENRLVITVKDIRL